jgi:predicted amidohydrolase
MLLKPAKIALAQTTSVLGDLPKNVERHAELAERALKENADVIIFPELSLTGYTVRDLNFENSIRVSSKTDSLKALKKLSKDITIICGGIEEDERGAVYNAALLIEGGNITHTHRKVYLPTYGLFEEGRYFRSGCDARAFDSSRLGRIGLLVCEDLWHPALPYIQALDDAQMIVTIAASPTRLDSGDDVKSSKDPENYTINREHHAAYARLLGSYFVFVNRVGVEDGVNFWGGSEVVAPSGETIARAKFFDEDLIYSNIHPEHVQQARQLSRHFLDENPLLTRHLLEKTIERRGRERL